MKNHKFSSFSFQVCLMGLLGLLLTNIQAKAEVEADFTIGQLDYKILSIEDMTVEVVFCNDENVVSIEVPPTVSFENKEYKVIGIGDYAFREDRFLKEINLNEGLLYIGSAAFMYCVSLEEITVPNTVEQIGSFCFTCCTSLTTVELPPNLKEIPSSCFRDCDLLSSINIPPSVKLIKELAFTHCHSLTSIELPPDVEISGDAFSSCANLTEIILNDNPNYCFEEGFLYSKDKSVLVTGLESIGEEVVIKDCVKVIGEGAFDWNLKLKTVVIPESVVSIRKNAFGNVDYLKTVVCYAVVPPECDMFAFWSDLYFMESDKFPEAVFVPDESVEKYKETTTWRGKHIYPISQLSGVEDILEMPQRDDHFTVYTLDGRIVMQTDEGDSLKSLPEGIYIVNGKKVLIRK